MMAVPVSSLRRARFLVSLVFFQPTPHKPWLQQEGIHTTFGGHLLFVAAQPNRVDPVPEKITTYLEWFDIGHKDAADHLQHAFQENLSPNYLQLTPAEKQCIVEFFRSVGQHAVQAMKTAVESPRCASLLTLSSIKDVVEHGVVRRRNAGGGQQASSSGRTGSSTMELGQDRRHSRHKNSREQRTGTSQQVRKSGVGERETAASGNNKDDGETTSVVMEREQHIAEHFTTTGDDGATASTAERSTSSSTTTTPDLMDLTKFDVFGYPLPPNEKDMNFDNHGPQSVEQFLQRTALYFHLNGTDLSGVTWYDKRMVDLWVTDTENWCKLEIAKVYSGTKGFKVLDTQLTLEHGLLNVEKPPTGKCYVQSPYNPLIFNIVFDARVAMARQGKMTSLEMERRESIDKETRQDMAEEKAIFQTKKDNSWRYYFLHELGPDVVVAVLLALFLEFCILKPAYRYFYGHHPHDHIDPRTGEIHWDSYEHAVGHYRNSGVVIRGYVHDEAERELAAANGTNNGGNEGGGTAEQRPPGVAPAGGSEDGEQVATAGEVDGSNNAPPPPGGPRTGGRQSGGLGTIGPGNVALAAAGAGGDMLPIDGATLGDEQNTPTGRANGLGGPEGTNGAPGRQPPSSSGESESL
ncbi:unnamed protein product [Amoebophrya sp. A120]|nr:unnamed protein product [Amoebophrya sp. A120]|eukprot:GSA120T00023284001.1